MRREHGAAPKAATGLNVVKEEADRKGTAERDLDDQFA